MPRGNPVLGLALVVISNLLSVLRYVITAGQIPANPPLEKGGIEPLTGSRGAVRS